MIELPKIADISSLKGLSIVLALPMLCVAYTLQTGLQITWGDRVFFEIPVDSSEVTQLVRLLFIFTLKSVFISIIGLIAYDILFGLHLYFFKFPLIELISTLLIAFGLLGVFGIDLFRPLHFLNSFWFYGCLVWGLFLHSAKEQFNKKLEL